MSCKVCGHVHSGQKYPPGSNVDYCGARLNGPSGGKRGTCACDGIEKKISMNFAERIMDSDFVQGDWPSPK